MLAAAVGRSNKGATRHNKVSRDLLNELTGS